MLDFIIRMVGTSPIEIAAVTCGLINVILIVRRSIWNYPFGFVMVLLYARIFYDYQLYSDALLQIYFFGIQFYGLYCWLRGRGDDGRVEVQSIDAQRLRSWLVVTAAGWLVLSVLMHRFTDASLPYWDAAIAALSMLAQLLLSRRYIESWMFWVIVDVLAIGLFSVKGLYPTAALYGVFLALAITGWLQWRQQHLQQATAAV
ncbi:nicotinamide riboside transporter PnuC [Marinobacter sp. OP 3.4]|uniref:nicotinamide riboside transporter PnuC n=1 Tax=Marinobacter sp. OP 3.4 TaxID=3076501 RepID=UPI002E1D713B